jgi:hypothetical protein
MWKRGLDRWPQAGSPSFFAALLMPALGILIVILLQSAHDDPMFWVWIGVMLLPPLVVLTLWLVGKSLEHE